MRENFKSLFLWFLRLLPLGFAVMLSGCGSIDNAISDPAITQVLKPIFNSGLESSLQGTLDLDYIFPVLIHSFNLAIIGGSLMIFAYIAMMGTLYTAQDGIFLGKKWSKTLIPLRAVFGIVAVFPLGSTGFGIAQYIIYSMTYMGVGIADQVWGSVAGHAGPSGSAPELPQSVVQAINTGIAEMTFYEVLNQVNNPTHVSLNASLKKHSSLMGATNSEEGSANCRTDTAPASPPGRGVIPLICSSRMTLHDFQYFNSAVPSVSGASSSNILNAIHANSACTNATWCTDALSFITLNLSNASISGDATIGNLGFLDQNALGTNSPAYVESDFEYQVKETFGPLVSPPHNLNDPTGTGQIISGDPVSESYSTAGVLTSQIMSMSGDLVFDSADFESGQGQVITDLMKEYDASKTTAGSKNVKKPEDFSLSWWYAGDEYLYLDQEFAEEMTVLASVGSKFLAVLSSSNSQQLTKITKGGVYADIRAMTFPSKTINAASLITSACLSGGTSCSFLVIPMTGSIVVPMSLSGYIAKLAAQVTADRTDWPLQSPMWFAAMDFICKLGGGDTYCATTNLNRFAPPPPGGSVIPQALNLSQGPFPLIQSYIFYYFSLRDTLGKTGNYPAMDIYRLDAALNYANNMYLAVNGPEPCPPNTAGCNSNSPSWANPMIIAGSVSPLGNVMGFLFSGLIGAQSGSQNIAGLLGQIWCVGEVDFGTCMNQIQMPTASAGEIVSGKNLVSAHFSVIANAQLVGMNLIGGTVAALTSVYTIYTKKVDAVVKTFQDNEGKVKVAAIAGMSLLGPAYGAAQSKKVIDGGTAASVSVAALSVNLMWLPVIMIVLTTLFTTGVLFSVFIPMLPFILFWAGKIAWLLLVIEAIFAAPLMAMAMAYPEGHDLWGMGEQGFKISLNLLLMPVLMIVGLVSAMVITYFILNITASGFHYVSYSLLQMASQTSANPEGLTLSGMLTPSSKIVFGSSPLGSAETVNSLITQGIMCTLLIFMYATFISMAFNKSFSTIYVIPERVMSWIGSQGMKFGEKEGGEMQGAVTKQAEQAGQAGGQAVSQGTQAQKALGDAKISQGMQDGQAEIQMGNSVGQSVQQDIGTISSVAGMFKGE
jgi:hypothetical protein